jgi:hypothetical protein
MQTKIAPAAIRTSRVSRASAACVAIPGTATPPIAVDSGSREIDSGLREIRDARVEHVEDSGADAAPAPPALDAGSTRVDAACPSDLPGPRLVSVPTPDGGSYCIDATEVTRGDYARFLAALSQDAVAPIQPPVCEWNTSFMGIASTPQTEALPMVGVDWCDAVAFCTWAGKRLCGKIGGGAVDYTHYALANESQWYNACSAGGTKTYRDVDITYYQRRGRGICAGRRVRAVELDALREWRLIRHWLERGQAEFIFIDYALQRPLYEAAKASGATERQLAEWFQYPRGPEVRAGIIRHVPNHANHVHVRFRCAADDRSCKHAWIRDPRAFASDAKSPTLEHSIEDAHESELFELLEE